MALLWLDSTSYYNDNDIVCKCRDSGYNDVETMGTNIAGENQYMMQVNQTNSGAYDFEFVSGEYSTNTLFFSWYMWLNLGGLSNNGHTFLRDSDAQFTLKLNRDGSVSAYRGTNSDTLLATSERCGLYTQRVFHHCELKLKVANAPSGEFFLKIDGDLVFSGEGLDTQNQASAGVNRMSYRGDSTNSYCAYMTVFDDTGSYMNDWAGPLWIRALPPITSGEFQDWLPSGETTNLACVDDTGASPPDIDFGTYIGSVTDGDIDTYEFTDLTELPGQTIHGVQVSYFADHNNSPVHPDGKGSSTAGVFRTETTFEKSGEWGVMLWRAKTDANNWWTIWERNPSGEIEWTTSDINDAQFGVKLNTGQT